MPYPTVVQVIQQADDVACLGTGRDMWDRACGLRSSLVSAPLNRHPAPRPLGKLVSAAPTVRPAPRAGRPHCRAAPSLCGAPISKHEKLSTLLPLRRYGLGPIRFMDVLSECYKDRRFTTIKRSSSTLSARYQAMYEFWSLQSACSAALGKRSTSSR